MSGTICADTGTMSANHLFASLIAIMTGCMLGCGSASPVVTTTPEALDEPTVTEVVEEEVDEEVVAALAMLDLLDQAEIPPLEGDLKVWREWDGVRWGVAALEEGQEEWSGSVRVGLGARAYVSREMAEDTNIVDLIDEVSGLPASLERMAAAGRPSDTASIIAEGRIHSVMALTMARRALAEGQDALARRFARLAVDLPHQSSPYDAGPLQQLRGDIAYALTHYALQEFALSVLENSDESVARLIGRLDQVAALDGTEASVRAAELAEAFRERQSRAAAGGPDPAFDLFAGAGGDTPQLFQSADLAGKVAIVLPMLDDSRPLNSANMRSPLDVVRVKERALMLMSELAGVNFGTADAAREWWAATNTDGGWESSLARIVSPIRYQHRTHMERLIEIDRPRAERELSRRYATFSGYERSQYLQMFLAVAEAPANVIIRRLMRSRNVDDHDVVVRVMMSGGLADDDRAKAKLADWFGDLVDDGLVRSERGQMMAQALIRLNPDALAPHWSLLPSRFRGFATMQMESLDAPIVLAVLRDQSTLSVTRPNGGLAVADLAAVRAASLLNSEFDINAPLPERVAEWARLREQLEEQQNFRGDPVEPPAIQTFERSAATVYVDDPSGRVRSWDNALAVLDAETLSRDVVYRFLTALIRSSRRTMSRIAIRQRGEGFYIEILLRPVDSENPVSWQGHTVSAEPTHASGMMSAGSPSSPIFDGRGGWTGMEPLIAPIFADETCEGAELELRW